VRPAGAPVNASMITELIRYELPADQVEPFLAAYREALRHLLADGHCYGAEVLHGVEAPTRVVIRIEWDSIEGHEAHFTNGPNFEPFIAPLRPYLQHIVEMAHYERVAEGR
jgi:quinol monooxygenase YgiN